MPLQGFQKKPITPKQSLGAKLAATRKKKNLSLEKAEIDTRIRAHYLEAIEEERFAQLPPAQMKGFIRHYGDYLGIPSSEIEQDLELLPLTATKRSYFSPRLIEKETRWLVTPRTLAVLLSIIVLVLFIGYVTYQVRQFAAPPELEITTPQNEAVVTAEQVTIEGRTEPGGLILVDTLQANVNPDGTFTYALTLRPGLNQITIQAENRIKKQTTRVLSLLYQPPAPSPEVSPSPEASPTASP